MSTQPVTETIHPKPATPFNAECPSCKDYFFSAEGSGKILCRACVRQHNEGVLRLTCPHNAGMRGACKKVIPGPSYARRAGHNSLFCPQCRRRIYWNSRRPGGWQTTPVTAKMYSDRFLFDPASVTALVKQVDDLNSRLQTLIDMASPEADTSYNDALEFLFMTEIEPSQALMTRYQEINK